MQEVHRAKPDAMPGETHNALHLFDMKKKYIL